MCTIDKMLIKGIRSFSPDNKAVIQFYKPLTLIVGANGAGKTTIIECLKQACTGELPPNTRSGQSFVHDPKVAHETEVKAQIKLRFFTGNGQEITVLRVFQLTQKKTKLEFKTLDCTMSTPNAETGQKTAVTYRCADIDKMVPSLMGVSKAVLENVIFVHQEESNWPLAEGKVLKDRFDDIFAATKYTKALESLRKLRTEKTQEIKTMKLQLDHLRTHRDNAARLQDEVERAQEQIDRHAEEAEELDRQVQEKVEQVESLGRSLDTLRQLSRDIQVANARLEELSKQAVAKRAQLQDTNEYNESTEEIRQLLADFDRTVDSDRLQVNRLQREVVLKRQNLQAQQDVHNQNVKRHSTLAADKASYDTAIADRDAFIRETAPRVSISLGGAEHSDRLLPEGVVAGFAADLLRHKNEMQRQLQAAKENSRQKDEEMNGRVDALNARLTQHQEQLRIKRDQIRSNKATADSLSAQAEAVVINETMAADTQRRVDQAQDGLRAKMEEQGKADLDAKLAREKREIDEVEQRITDIRLERDRLSSASETATRLRVKAQDLAEKREALDTIVRTRRAKLLQLVGAGDLPAVPQLRPRCEAALAARKRELETQQETLNQQQAAESTARAQLEAVRSSLSSLEGQRSQLLAQLRLKVQASAELPVVFEPNRAVENERALEAVLAARKTAFDECTRKLNSQEVMKKYFQRVRQLMCDNNSCPACYRGFGTKEELESSLHQLDDDAQNYPAKVVRLQAATDKAAAEHRALTALQPTWRRVVDIETREMRELRDRITPLEESLATATAAVQETAEVLGAMQMEVAEATQLVTEAVWQIDRQYKDVATLQEEVMRLEAAVTASQTTGGGRTLSQLDEDLDTAELEKRSKEGAREMTLKRQNRLKEDILKMTRELSEAREALNQSRQRIDRKAELLAKVADLEAANQALQVDIARQEREGQPLLDEKEAAMANRAQMRTLMNSEMDQCELALRNANQLLDSFNNKMSPIQSYEQRQGAAALARATLALEESQALITKLTKEIESKETEAREKNLKLQEQETLRHQMQDVLELRVLEEQLQAQDMRIRDLEGQQQQIGQESALSMRCRAVEAERNALKQRLDMLKGQRMAQQQTVERAQGQLKAPEFKDIVTRYNKQYAEVLYTEMANADLDKYHKALERALLSFHTTKMADINKIIKELWQKTYRGQDIDYIQIKADAESQTTTSRSYNYRVVMYSGGAELEMRGRCSAGQKVLACLIIRLALAETFCLNCGILALDEPTTNLDADNAGSLAEALRAIMVARREQENFQLIVITHDENFAHQIGTREQAEFLWRITKDDNQHTHLAQERIEDQ